MREKEKKRKRRGGVQMIMNERTHANKASERHVQRGWCGDVAV